MPNSYLSYWKPGTARTELASAGAQLVHAASNQYGRVRAGDTLWIGTTWPPGQLAVLGRMRVGELVGQKAAETLFGTASLWTARYHAIAATGTAEALRDVAISDIASQLRFESKNDRLEVRAGYVHGNQLQSMRQLTVGSAEILTARWTEGELLEAAATAATNSVHAPTGFGDPATNRRVETFAVTMVTDVLQSEGWSVRSVESLRIGYDLRCVRATEELHVEVKGVQAQGPCFIVTHGERRRAETDPFFAVYVVTRALSAEARLHRFNAREFLGQFAFSPLAYRVVPRADNDAE